MIVERPALRSLIPCPLLHKWRRGTQLRRSCRIEKTFLFGPSLSTCGEGPRVRLRRAGRSEGRSAYDREHLPQTPGEDPPPPPPPAAPWRPVRPPRRRSWATATVESAGSTPGAASAARSAGPTASSARHRRRSPPPLRSRRPPRGRPPAGGGHAQVDDPARRGGGGERGLGPRGAEIGRRSEILEAHHLRIEALQRLPEEEKGGAGESSVPSSRMAWSSRRRRSIVSPAGRLLRSSTARMATSTSASRWS